MNCDRDTLIELLSEAAELEHSLCLQYLYAAFSLKSRPEEPLVTPLQIEMIRDWKAAILKTCREEMLHLGLVCNLLSAIGARPHLRRPNFPQQASYYPMGVASHLAPFAEDTLGRFIRFEAPVDVVSPKPSRSDKRTIGELYCQVRKGFMTLDEDLLFIGDDKKQITGTDIIDPTGVFEEEVATGYGVEPFAITDRESALRAIELIVEQGEGAPTESEDSHYHRFSGILREYQTEMDTATRDGQIFDPARPVLTDPVCRRQADAPNSKLITHPATLEVAELFNESYQTMILMMVRFYARVDDTPEELFALQQTAFFPLMTMVIRPLGELLTELPAFEDRTEVMAGGSFELSRSVGFLPHKVAAYRIFQERLWSAARRARSLTYLCREELPTKALVVRLRFIVENVDRMAHNFEAFLQRGISE